MSNFEFGDMQLFRKRTLALTAMLVIVLSASDGYCNVAIPGTLMIVGGFFSSNALQWIVVNMVMCITIEGAIYHYCQILDKPFLGSLAANFISLVAGIPLIVFGIIDPTGVILPTAASIWIELMVLKAFRKKVSLPDSEKITYTEIGGYVVLANILTNGLMIVYIVQAFTNFLGI